MFMKKLMMIAAMMVAALTASAQNEDRRNELSLSYGFGSAFRGFAEFGFGDQGILMAGVRYKF